MTQHLSPPRNEQQKQILVINPNSNLAVTTSIQREARHIVSRSTQLHMINPLGSPHSIETRAHRAAAEPLVVSLILDTLAHPYDAYVLACFDDIAITQARTALSVPVVGACEAGIAAARTVARRFSIVTTVHSAVPGIQKLIEDYGASAVCTVRAAGVGVAEAAQGSGAVEQKIYRAIDDAITLDGAEAILLGSGGLVSLAAQLRQSLSIPIIDSVMAAIKMAEGLAQLNLGGTMLRSGAANTT